MLTAFSIRLDRINESLLYQDKAGNYWVSGVLVFETDAKGRTIVVQSIPPERFAAGERGPQLGHWRSIGKPKPPTPSGKGFDLAKYKSAAQPELPIDGKHPQEESLFPSPETAFDGVKPEPKPAELNGFDDLGF